MTCPNCGRKLEPLFTVDTFEFDGIWACRECPYGLNRWVMKEERLVPLVEKDAESRLRCPVTPAINV